ncbi:bifunctional diguanylate cyclase/phosphodiesterase [Alteromonas sp. ASW11-36]|uniref:Bifunctional diguanylate cyclase/phosphodiesterase n=1 Tax=Alteromonas arenosi TaxID=3055817 RepID=A0ABT7SSU6_9ALTE|nr:bifunctional diguanylate cyclase/phosphodiesterase [Alteromonas sp. ASW11-36]MDM7859268.1 bifunctional diguanylate cyclase/phosphodiesterase [Alteromonas sp. ASW11-36]
MAKKVSVAQKLVLVLISLLVLFSALLGGLLIYRSNADLTLQQRQIQMQYYKQYQLLSSFINDRLVSFVENFASDAQLQSVQKEDEYARLLSSQYEELTMRWQVEDIAFFTRNGQRTLYSEQLTDSVAMNAVANDVMRFQRPESKLVCAGDCVRILGVPIMTSSGIAVVVVEYTLAEVLASFARSTLAQIAVVSMPEQSLVDITLQGQLTEVNRQRFAHFIGLLPDDLNYPNFYQYGHVVHDDNRALLITTMPLAGNPENRFYALAVTDVSDRYYALQNYQWIVIGFAILLSFGFVLMLSVLLRQYRLKLENLSQRLPLLAENRFEEFRDTRILRQRWFEDELDQLEASADSLATNLEQLNQQALADQVQLEKMAMFDALTGLPNRSMLMFQIDKHIASLKRTNRAVALMFLDLDDFKSINDTHGHGVGDSLLKQVATRISKQLRETDIAARFGGDEYAILLTDIERTEDANVVAEKIINAFAKQVNVKDLQFFVAVSIGIAVTREHDITAVELLRHADIAMYEAKAVSGSVYRTYDASMNLKLIRRVEVENEARNALQCDEFYLALQPKIDLQTHRLHGFEALIRWKHPQKGFVSPAEFIPILEKSSLMVKVDYWIIARSLSILSELTINGFGQLNMAVNVSASQFLDANLVEYLRQQLRHFDIEAHRVELELTETALVDDLTRACDVMNQVRELGCRISIDDFGTGYSSLSYLKAMPADTVKIDQSFVKGMLDDQGDRNIVYSTLTMVRGMGIEVVAEGIESAEQFDLLNHFGCDLGQGYYIAKPIDEKDIWQALNKSCIDGIWQLPLPVHSE